MLKSFICMICLFGLTQNALAWKETGGGDEVGIEFQSSFAKALREIQNGTLKGHIDPDLLSATALKTSVIVVDEALRVTAQGITQDSIATNDPARNLIKINRARWKAIRDPRTKEAIALHEVLSLVGLERTGLYEYSGLYASERGLSPWEVSGERENASRPAPKRLVCEITYSPAYAKYEQIEVLKVDMTSAPERMWLAARQKLETKDGRYAIEVWGIQPFRSAFNLTAYEYVGISFADLKNKTNSVSGPTIPIQATKNESYVKAAFITDYDNGAISTISGSCSFQ